MKKVVLAVAATMLAAACQETSGPRPSSPEPPPGFNPSAAPAAGQLIEGQYIVVLRESVTDVPSVARELLARYGGSLGHTYTNALKGFSGNISAEAAAAIALDPRVAYVEQNQVMRAITEQANATWGIDRIDQRDLPLSGTYVYNATGKGVDAYIIDTGIRMTHQEFGGRAVHGADEVDKDNDANDCNGHGTHVAGTVGGTKYGVAKDVKLIAIRVLDCGGSGSNADVIAGVDTVTALHQAGQPAVANMSLGGGFSQALNDAVKNSVNDGVTYAVAAGNDYSDPCLGSTSFFGPQSPASEPSAITVGATNRNDGEADFSDRGPCLDIWAPGVDVTSAWYTSDTATNTISGTSMATPHVAGGAALYLEENPAATPSQVDQELKTESTKDHITWNNGPFGQKKPAPANYLLYTANFVGGPPPSPPAAPSNLTATAVSSSRIDLAWTDNSNNEDGFKIDRCQGAGCTNFAQVATAGANATSYQDTGRSASTTYRYRVRAYNGGGNSDYSNEAEATTPAAPPPPAAPSDLTATAVSNSQINLTWTDNSNDEDGFKIERCQGAGCTNFAQIDTVGPNVTSYQNTGLTPGTTYSYRVRAHNSNGNSGYSNTATATTFDNPPVARYNWNCNSKGGRGCNFDGTPSTDDKGISTYSWDFGDGATATGSRVSHTYSSRGTFTVKLTVTDNASPGQSNSCSKSVPSGTSGSCP